MNYKLIDLSVTGDNHGHLLACEYTKNCPFDVKRVFWIFDTKPGIVIDYVGFSRRITTSTGMRIFRDYGEPEIPHPAFVRKKKVQH